MKRKILACILTLTMIMGTVPNGSFSVLASDFEPLGETTAIDDGYWEETEDVLADGETTGIIEDEQDDPAINTDNETVSYNASTDDPGEESLIDVQSSDSIFDELSIPQEYEDEISQEEESDFSLASNDGNDEQDSEEYCTVTWDANGGKFFLGYDENDEKIYQDTIEVQIEKDNSTMAPYDKIVREGYTLQGWSSEFSGGGINLIASYRDDKDRHYYAIWSPETPMEMQLGQEYSGTIEKREALVFQFIPEESGIYAFRLTDSENTIYPKYYYVDADSNRYSWGMGYETYGGYFEEKEAYQVVLIAYHESSLYSLSVDKSNYISQYWNANGGIILADFNDDGEPVYAETYESSSIKGQRANLSFGSWEGYERVTREGYILTGWTDQDGNSYGLNDNVYPEEDTTFTAIWTKAIKITWDANGGQLLVGYDDDESPIYSEIYEVVHGEGDLIFLDEVGGWSVDQITKEGYVLTGWTDQYGNTYGKYDNVNSEEDTTYTAIWTKAIKITWDANGGQLQVGYTNDGPPIYSEIYEVAHAEGERLYLSNAGGWGVDQVTKEGYVLTGWIDQYGNTYEKYDEVNPKEDTTYTAIWTKAIKIIWNANGGQLQVGYDDDESPIYSETYERVSGEGERLYLSTAGGWGVDRVTKEGYVLTGWIDQYGNTYGKYDEVNPKEDTTYTAIWTKAIKITWDANGGQLQVGYDDDEFPIYSETYEGVSGEGEGLYLSTAGGWGVDQVTKEGYVITGWTDQYGNKYGKYDEVNPEEDTTFTAIWTKAIKITWKADGGQLQVGYDDDDDESPIYSEIYEVAHGEGDLLYLGDAGGWGVDQVTKEGYVLTGWTDQYGNKYGKYDEVKPEEDTTFTAIWTKAIKITWDANGGQLLVGYDDDESPIYSETYEGVYGEGEDLYLGSLRRFGIYQVIREGYALTGWTDQKGNKYDKYDEVVPEEDMIFYPVWEEGVKVTWDLNGGNIQGEATFTDIYAIGREVYINRVINEPDGKALIGWTTEKNDESTLVIEEFNAEKEFKASEETTLYALWDDAYFITWDGNGGHTSWDDDQLLHIEKWPKSRDINHTWAFDNENEELMNLGWSTSKDAKDIVLSSMRLNSYQLTGDTTLYAIWVPRHEIIFMGNGHTIWQDSTETIVSYNYPEGFSLQYMLYADDVDENIRFIGWSTSKEAKDLLNGDYQVKEDMTVYAIWSDQIESEPEPEPQHTEHTIEILEGKAATCKETGLTEGSKCSVCGEILVPQKEIPVTEHTVEKLEGKNPTCTESGLTEGKRCSVCGEVLEKQQEIPALGHTPETVPSKVPTCKETGLTEGSKCSVCGVILVPQEEIPVTEHTVETLEGKDPTCTETGLTDGKRCSVCGEVLEEQQEIPALGHTSETIPGKAATSIETGLTEGERCSVCGEILTSQEIIEKLTPTMTLNVSGTLLLKKGQTSKAVTVSELAAGDSVKSVKSSNKKVLKVSCKNGTITLKALNKIGTSTVTVLLKSGLKKTFKVKVQKTGVKTTKITGLKKKITVKKGKTVSLKPVLTPITSTQKITYSTSDKKIATITSKGVIKGIKAGSAKITVKSGSKKFVVTVIVK